MGRFEELRAGGCSIEAAVDQLLCESRRTSPLEKFQGPWYRRPGIMGGLCGRGFRFHEMGLQHGPDSAFAKRLRAKAEAGKS